MSRFTQILLAIWLATCFAALCAFILESRHRDAGRRASRVGFFALLLASAVATLNSYETQAEKTGTQGVDFPYTDADAIYLYDTGSYVTNDAVHLAFTTLLVPSTGTIYLDYREKMSGTNTNEWNTAFALPLGSLDLPLDYPFPAATNYTWMCYTDWTPGGSATTNDTYVINWTIAQPVVTNALPDTLVPLRTTITIDGNDLDFIKD